jgi:hypothetical protein
MDQETPCALFAATDPERLHAQERAVRGGLALAQVRAMSDTELRTALARLSRVRNAPPLAQWRPTIILSAALTQRNCYPC